MSAPESLNIRPALRADLPAVVEIVRSSADWYAPFVEADDMDQHEVDQAWAEANFRVREFHVAETPADDVVGTLTIQDAGSALYLGYVYVHADHVGRRIGPALLRFAVKQARARGKESLVLIAHPDADWAVRAYERFGFETVSADPDVILAWNDGWLRPYYESGFALFRYRVTP